MTWDKPVASRRLIARLLAASLTPPPCDPVASLKPMSVTPWLCLTPLTTMQHDMGQARGIQASYCSLTSSKLEDSTGQARGIFKANECHPVALPHPVNNNAT